jgi:hypothetical protein
VKRVSWRDAEHRRDVRIVVGLFALGMLLTAAIGLLAAWLLQLVGWWDVPLTIDLGSADREFRVES